MATGDVSDILNRMRAVLPRWFPADGVIVNGLMTGFATGASFVYGLIGFADLQTRISTATDGWLDFISFDFFGGRLLRKQPESDASFRARIIAEITRERGTREGLRKALVDLTGREPIIFEPRRPADTGGYHTNSIGYSRAGGYGSLVLPFQAFLTAYRPASSGIPFVAGYGVPAGGYSRASRASYETLKDIIGGVTDADIYAVIDGVKPVASIIWTRLSSEKPSTAGLDFSDPANSQYLTMDIV